MSCVFVSVDDALDLRKALIQVLVAPLVSFQSSFGLHWVSMEAGEENQGVAEVVLGYAVVGCYFRDLIQRHYDHHEYCQYPQGCCTKIFFCGQRLLLRERWLCRQRQIFQ